MADHLVSFAAGFLLCGVAFLFRPGRGAATALLTSIRSDPRDLLTYLGLALGAVATGNWVRWEAGLLVLAGGLWYLGVAHRLVFLVVTSITSRRERRE